MERHPATEDDPFPVATTHSASSGDPGGEGFRRREVITAGYRGDTRRARTGLSDPDPAVRAAALGALDRIGAAQVADVLTGLADAEPAVRRRACDVAVAVRGRGSRSRLLEAVRAALGDEDPMVVEGACWVLGERRDRAGVAALAELASDHGDPRCREAAVGALGAIGDPGGLDAVLGRLTDKPAVRRRAAVALAAFDDPAADAALERCLADRDWQVRQIAATLLDVVGDEG